MTSKKDKRETRLLHGDELLEGRGIDLDAEDAVLLPALLAAAGVHPDADLSIADYLGSIASEESARRLLAWEDSHPADKDLLRIIRRSLFRLQQRGITAAVREKPVASPVRLIDPVEPTGYLSPLDGGGNRLAWLSRPRPEGGLIILSAVINDRTGMRHVEERLASKGQMKEILADMARQMAPLVAAPHRYVDWLMHEAYRRGAPRDDHGGGYPLLRADFYSTPAAETTPPLADLREEVGRLGEAGVTRLLDESARLFNEQEFAGWALPDDMVKVHQARFRDAQDSTIVLSKEMMTERLTSIVDQAFEEVFLSPARALYAARLREMALWYSLAGRPDPARTCLAVGEALADPDRRLKEVSFLRALVFRSFLHLMPRGGPEDREKERDPGSLIVRPD